MILRIDKFLWAVRIFKTRSLATKACQSGKVKLNDVVVKPSRSVAINDIITLRRGPVLWSFRIKDLLKSRVGAKLVPDYLENLTPEEELIKLHRAQSNRALYREKGSGRPTKKERRDLEILNKNKADQIWDWDE